ncbi:putative molybdenum cofactor guanylyltransferase [bacterium BMS3Abin01]|nr:putative molybdenum cofactor guanylyltransferase [bacterium BMS3Abin01]HDY69897.1 molybdopterin-guanine dinucleotide biosynthesis protein B [Actinomycetota bacterium]
MVDARKISIAILAGGESSRMGRNKAMEELAGKPLILRVIEALSPQEEEAFIVGGEAATYRCFGLPHCADQFTFRASIVGIYSALAASPRKNCLAISCDLPFVAQELVELMAGLVDGHDAVVPIGVDGPEPLCAVYSRSCLDALEENISQGRFSLRRSLGDLDVRYVDEAELKAVCDPAIAFFNINTPGDLERAEELLAARGPTAAAPAHLRPPLVCFVSKKNSGKTTLIEKLVPRLREAGLEVAFIKHDVHSFSMDHEGTDTWRIARAGARQVVISSPGACADLKRLEREKSLAELRRQVESPVDIIVAEGYKSAEADRIEVSRSERSHELVLSEDELIAVVSDRPNAAASVPVFGMDDIDGLTSFLLERYRLGASRPGGASGAEGEAEGAS